MSGMTVRLASSPHPSTLQCRSTHPPSPPTQTSLQLFSPSTRSCQFSFFFQNANFVLQIEAEPGGYALYLVNETGERRVLTELEFPLLLRVKAGPHEDVAKIYLMDKQRTEEIPHQVAAFLRWFIFFIFFTPFQPSDSPMPSWETFSTCFMRRRRERRIGSAPSTCSSGNLCLPLQFYKPCLISNPDTCRRRVQRQLESVEKQGKNEEGQALDET